MLPCGEAGADSKGCRSHCPLAMRPGRGGGSRSWQGPPCRAARLEVWPCLCVGGTMPRSPNAPSHRASPDPVQTRPLHRYLRAWSLDARWTLVQGSCRLLLPSAPCRQRAPRGLHWGQESGGSGCARGSEIPHSHCVAFWGSQVGVGCGRSSLLALGPARCFVASSLQPLECTFHVIVHLEGIILNKHIPKCSAQRLFLLCILGA